MRQLTLGSVTASAVLAASLLAAAPASASGLCVPSGSAWSSDAGADTSLDCPPNNQTPPPPVKGKTASSGTKPACVWVPKPDYQPGAGQKANGDGGHWYTKFCSFSRFKTLADLQAELDSIDTANKHMTDLIERAGLEVRFFTTPPPRRTPQEVMASLAGRLPYPPTYIAVNPIATKQILGVPTWVWLTDAKGTFVPNRYQPDPKTIVLEGYPLRWQIVPQLTLKPGDGGPDQTCEGAGVAWSASADGDPAACTVTYSHAGRYTLSASVGWTVKWWLANEPQDDIPGPTNTATRPVTVLEVQTLSR